MVKAVIFDFGGVLAEEGFREGLNAIGKKFGVSGFFSLGERLIYDTGYVTGKASEADFWDAMRRESGIKATDAELRNEILSRFVIRPEMLREVDQLRRSGLRTAVLSDQTDWLEEIDHREGLYGHFDVVYNSYRLHKGKRDASVFAGVCADMGVRPEEALFVDDQADNISRAKSQGLRTIHFVSSEDFFTNIKYALQETV